MKNIFALLIIIGVILWQNYVFSYQDCSSQLSSCNYWTNQYNNSSYYDSSYTSYYNLSTSYCNDYKNCLAVQQQQSQQMIQLNQQWMDSYNAWQYEDALGYFQQALVIIWDDTDQNYKIVQNNMILSYNELWTISLAKDDRNSALKYFSKTLTIDKKNVLALYKIWYIDFQKENYKTELWYFNQANNFNTNLDDISDLQFAVNYKEFRIKEIIAQKNWVTDDYYSYRWLSFLNMNNIVNAWTKVKTADANEVIVAIIDDGIYINHPDLSSNIRVNTGEVPNDWKDNDGNWYKDDYNWWNFVYNNNNLMPLWTHWTMIAWIIWAVRDNKEWIAWIVKKVKLMPIGVCSFGTGNQEWGCSDDNIIKWINYAIDNWANIINLSLGWTQFNFTNKYNNVIRRAYDKWIIVVAAAWNWDILTNWTIWVNMDTQPLSPVCNYGDNPKRIIWVSALDSSWYKAEWSNYWKCATFYALGEWIFSTVIPEEISWSMKSIYNFWISSYNSYDFWDWTSFATPIVVWIIWLWYNKYGQVRPDLVWDALKESMGSWIIIDASKYLDILWEKIRENPLDYNQMKVWISYKISEVWYNIQMRFSRFLLSFQKSESTIDSIKSANLNWIIQ